MAYNHVLFFEVHFEFDVCFPMRYLVERVHREFQPAFRRAVNIYWAKRYGLKPTPLLSLDTYPVFVSSRVSLPASLSPPWQSKVVVLGVAGILICGGVTRFGAV